jgi:putative alpha-1,2-mannosidase
MRRRLALIASVAVAERPLAWGGGAGRVRVASRRELEGEVQTGAFCAQRNRQTVYFVVRAAADAAAAAGTFLDDVASAAPEVSGFGGGWMRFPSGRTVELTVGLSCVSVDGARANLEAELDGRGFDEVRRAAEDTWEATLGRVRVEGGSDAGRRTFYTALYHALLHPSVAGDVDGSYRRFGDRAVAVDVAAAADAGDDAAHERHHVFSLWDTYRTVHPLLALVYPERQRDFARSLLAMTVEAGAPPMWELAGWEVQMMVGDPADIVLDDAGVRARRLRARAAGSGARAAGRSDGGGGRGELACVRRSGDGPLRPAPSRRQLPRAVRSRRARRLAPPAPRRRPRLRRGERLALRLLRPPRARRAGRRDRRDGGLGGAPALIFC